jgi:hypothetical protein
MTGEAPGAPDPVDEPPPNLPSSDELNPVDYVLSVDEALWEVSGRLIPGKHLSVRNLMKLRDDLAALAKFMREMIYPREANTELNELKRTFDPHGDSFLDMLTRTLTTLSDYIETLQGLEPGGTVAVGSPTSLGASVNVKGKKRDAFIKEFNQLQLKFQMTVNSLRA